MPSKKSRPARLTTIKAGGFLLMIVATILGVWQLPIAREFFSRASGTPANITVHTQSILGPLPRPWRNLAQGGEDHAWRLEPIRGAVEQLNPEYIRIDHIYDFYDVVGGTPGSLTFDFSKLDLLLDDITQVGAKPYIALSYMPSVLSSDLTGQPHSYQDWAVVVQKTIEHISGARKTEGVYYEVWNEPDLFGNWKTYGDKNYLRLYEASALGASRAQNTLPFKLGGAATTALYENWFTALADLVTTKNIRFDFFSWHHYTPELDFFDQDLQNIQSWIARYPQLDGQIEYHLTEWGHESDMSPQYDTMASAAHTVAGAITLVNPLVKSFVFEIQDGKDPNGKAQWGRWGLLTHNDFGATPKPRYWGLKMLDSLPEQRLQVSGQGTWVKALAAKVPESDSIETILANYDQRGTNHETVPVTFTAVEPGTYELSLEFLAGNTQLLKATTETENLTFLVPLPPHSVVRATLKSALP